MKIEITLSIFSDYNGLKLEINYRKIFEKHMKTWRLNNMLQHNDFFLLIKEEIKRYIYTNENQNITTQNL